MLKTDRFPGGKHFAVTFSYDDGDKADRRLVEIFNRYGMKATFNLIPSRFDGETVVSSGEVGSLYAGHEIACHTYSHPHLERLPLTGQVREISLCRAALEQLSGGIVRGMATPYGGKNSDTVAAMNALGIAYCRNAGVSGGLSVPRIFSIGRRRVTIRARRPLSKNSKRNGRISPGATAACSISGGTALSLTGRTTGSLQSKSARRLRVLTTSGMQRISKFMITLRRSVRS